MNFMFLWQERYVLAVLTCEMLFLPLEHKIHIFTPPCYIPHIFSHELCRILTGLKGTQQCC